MIKGNISKAVQPWATYEQYVCADVNTSIQKVKGKIEQMFNRINNSIIFFNQEFCPAKESGYTVPQDVPSNASKNSLSKKLATLISPDYKYSGDEAYKYSDMPISLCPFAFESDTHNNNISDSLFTTIIHELTHISYSTNDGNNYNYSKCEEWARNSTECVRLVSSNTIFEDDYIPPYTIAGCMELFFNRCFIEFCKGGACM